METTKVFVNSIPEAYSEFMLGFKNCLSSMNKNLDYIEELSIFTAKLSETENINEIYGWAKIDKQDHGYAVYWKDDGRFTPKELLQYFHKEMVDQFYSVTLSEILFRHHKDKENDHRYHITARGF